MNNYLKILGSVALTLGAISVYAASSVTALFSPNQGEEAFNKIFDLIRNAESSVKVSLYSWSDYGLDNAIEEALKKGVDVKVVLNPTLAQKSYILKRVTKLELLGAEFKRAKHNMHEKFTLVDDKTIVNSSANMSSGAKTKYSENFIFHYSEIDPSLANLVLDFKHEFAVLWNTGQDIITHDEGLSEELSYEFFDGNKVYNQPRYYDPGFYSSSQNFTLKKTKVGSKDYEKGRFYKMSRRGGVKNQTWFVKDMILEAINSAESQILVSLNHFNIHEISDALIEAVKRGVDVRLAVDNQEFKTSPNGKEMTPQFVKDWKSLSGNARKNPPVRVKFYSHSPSPMYWLLNHHKFILIDYQKSGKGTILLSGSYNVSKNAEHNQFDNMVFYGGEKYSELYTSFRNEFKNLWDLNRDQKEAILKDFLEPINGVSYRLHSKEAVSLNWDEMSTVRSEIFKKANGMFHNIYKYRNCMYYNTEKKQFEEYDFKLKKVIKCGK